MIAALDEIPRAAQAGDRGAVRFVIDEAERAVPAGTVPGTPFSVSPWEARQLALSGR
jgi:hypothetical protein